jgi:4'-phosphopantetheinyl transferase EntD
VGISVLSSCDASENAAATEVVSPFTNPSVAFTLVSDEDVKDFQLHPLEQEALGDAVSTKRKQDFILGRAAARKSLSAIGFPVVSPVLRGEQREPLWPVGVVGSISHSGAYGVAVAAWQQDVPALGIDIQKVEERYTDELIARFADPDEFDWVRSDPARRTERAVKLFSAKESIFKALYVLRRVWFAFDVAHLTPKECETGFYASVRLPALSTGVVNLEVGVSSYNGYILTGAWLSNPVQFATGE